MKNLIVCLCFLSSMPLMANVICKTDEISIVSESEDTVTLTTIWDGGTNDVLALGKMIKMTPKNKHKDYFFGYLATAYSTDIEPLNDDEYHSIDSLNHSPIGGLLGLWEFKNGDKVVAKFISAVNGYVARCE